MNCKQAQLLIASSSSLPKDAMNHAAECPACQGFERDATALEAAIGSLDATPPLLLRSRIRDRIASHRGPNWRAFAISAAIFAVLSTPVIQIAAKKLGHEYVKGDRIGTLPPFHAKLYGKDHMNLDMEAKGEIWFSGYAIRQTSRGTFDAIDDVEHGVPYQYWKPDGVAHKRAETWAGNGKQVTADERVQLLNRLGPTALSFGVKVSEKKGVPIQVFGRAYMTVATTYKLAMTKTGSLTSVERPTDQIVYRDSETGQVMRTELVATFLGGSTQTEVHDFEYAVPSEERFETATLAPTSVTMPAMRKPAKPGG